MFTVTFKQIHTENNVHEKNRRNVLVVMVCLQPTVKQSVQLKVRLFYQPYWRLTGQLPPEYHFSS